MQAVRRIAGADSDVLMDAGIAIAGGTVTALAAWAPSGLVGTAVSGPRWLLVLLPLLLGAPLALRRRAPLVMWIAIWAVIALQFGITGQPPQGLEWLVPLAATFLLAVHASLRRSALCVAGSVVLILAARHGLSVIPLLAIWLIGEFVRTRRQSLALAEQNAALQRQAEQARAAERARIARELHDIVAHHLSVVVLQAAGARASGSDAGPALAKIETSGRQALADTRRLLDVLHDSGPAHGDEPALGPQPGIGELDALADSVRAAGLPVRLVISGDHEALPAAVDVSVYRIVQEALTNVLKHAGPASADVLIGCAGQAVTIEVADDGKGESAAQPPTGHGLAGMRERVAIFGGELCAGPRPCGGFAVRARLPLGAGLP